MAHPVPPEPGYWQRWRHGIAVAVSLLLAYYLLNQFHQLALGAYEQAAGAGGTRAASAAFTALLVGAYLLLAPVLVSRLVGDVESPVARDRIQLLAEMCRSRQEGFERALDLLAETVGLDWQGGAFGRIRALVRQGRDRDAAELYRREADVTDAEAGEAIGNWDANAAEVKLQLLLRHLGRTTSEGAAPRTRGDGRTRRCTGPGHVVCFLLLTCVSCRLVGIAAGQVSSMFDPPKSGKIAVKVISHFGDEVLKVYPVTACNAAK